MYSGSGGRRFVGKLPRKEHPVHKNGAFMVRYRPFWYTKTNCIKFQFLIGEYCGYQAPDPVIIPGSHGIVRFETDSAESLAGFQIRWSAVDGRTLSSYKITDSYTSFIMV